MSYITHSKDEFNRTVCKKRKLKRTGLYIQSSPSFHILFHRERRGIYFTGIIPEYFFEVYILAQSFYFSIHNIDVQCLRLLG